MGGDKSFHSLIIFDHSGSSGFPGFSSVLFSSFDLICVRLPILRGRPCDRVSH